MTPDSLGGITGTITEQLQDPNLATQALTSLLPEDSPVNDFLSSYNTIDTALSAAGAVGVFVPDAAAAQLANAGLGLYGNPATASWYASTGPTQIAGVTNAGSSAIGGALSGLATGLGYAGLFLGGMTLLSGNIFKGGSDDSAKTSKFFGSLQEKTPEQRIETIDNLLNVGWANETQTDFAYVVKPLFEQNIINEYYPGLYSADSQYDLFEGTWTNKLAWEGYQQALLTGDKPEPGEIREEVDLAKAGIQAPMASLEKKENADEGDTGYMGGLYMDMSKLNKLQLGDNVTKMEHAQKVYDSIRASGFTGDLSKLEDYLGI